MYELLSSRSSQSRPLKASMLGLTRELADYYHYLFSRADQQKMINAHSTFGRHAQPTVGCIHFHSLSSLRKTCLSVVDPANYPGRPFTFRPRSLPEMERYLSGPGSPFTSQIKMVRFGARPGFRFPILVFWKIEELVPTSYPDTFVEAKIVPLIPQAELCVPCTPDITPRFLFESALLKDELLYPYVDGTCMVCNKAGVQQRLQNCA